MKQSVKYTSMTIAGKLRTELKINVNGRNNPEWTSSNAGDKNTSVALYPIVSVTIIRPNEVDENGRTVRPPWNPNDSLGMTKHTLPIFVRELAGIQEDLKIPKLYTYTGKRLELNEELAAKIRRVFSMGSIMVVELSAVVITRPEDDARIEGIKMKFNNEQSHVLLTLNDIEALRFDLASMDVNSLAMLLYLNYITKPDHPTNFNASTITTEIDIAPKSDIDNFPI